MFSKERDHYYEYDIYSDSLMQLYCSVFSYSLSEKDHFLSFNQIQDLKLDQDDEEECFYKKLTKNPDFLTNFAENKELNDGEGEIDYLPFASPNNLSESRWLDIIQIRIYNSLQSSVNCISMQEIVSAIDEDEKDQPSYSKSPKGRKRIPSGNNILRIDCLIKKMARGFRKVVTVFIEEVIDSDPVIAKFVSDLRQMNGTKCCDKSKRKLSNKPTAAERKLFLGHSIIRLGKSLYDKYPHFEPIFWKEDYSKLKPVCQPKLNSSKNQCNGDQSLNEDYEENHSQSKEAHIDPAILAKQREKILNLMSSVIKIKIQKNEFFE